MPLSNKITAKTARDNASGFNSDEAFNRRVVDKVSEILVSVEEASMEGYTALETKIPLSYYDSAIKLILNKEYQVLGQHTTDTHKFFIVDWTETYHGKNGETILYDKQIIKSYYSTVPK